MGIPALGGLTELVDDELRGRLIRVAHAKVNDVLAPLTGLQLEIRDDVEDIGREATNPLEIAIHGYENLGLEACTEIEEQ